MYNTFYGLTSKPFQLNPDPDFFFGSKGHSRATAYLEYGLSQEEGFIVITGEVGAGKTTLVRNLCRQPAVDKIVVAHIVNSALDSADVLRMVVAAFGQPFENISKVALLMRFEIFMRDCHAIGKRLLLIVDEAQNLSRQALEELRMLSNLQCGNKPMLQTFLLGQPEFRETMMSEEMKQLRQRVIATYHLGPLDADETKAYIEHRLLMAGWRNDPAISDEVYSTIHWYTQGIPRNINALCDRLFLMGYLEDLHSFGTDEVGKVIVDLQQEFPVVANEPKAAMTTTILDAEKQKPLELEQIEAHVTRMESSLVSLLDALRKMVAPSRLKSAFNKDKR